MQTLSSYDLGTEESIVVANFIKTVDVNPVFGLAFVNDTAYVGVWNNVAILEVTLDDQVQVSVKKKWLGSDSIFSFTSTDSSTQPGK